MINKYKIYNEDNELVSKGGLLEILELLINLGYKVEKTEVRNNLDIAMLITDAILNQFEKNGKVDIPLDEHKYSFPLQDRIQIELEKITESYLNKRVRIKGWLEFYGKVIREYSSEVLVAVEDIAKHNELYFKKSEVEIVNE